MKEPSPRWQRGKIVQKYRRVQRLFLGRTPYLYVRVRAEFVEIQTFPGCIRAKKYSAYKKSTLFQTNRP